MKEIRLTRGYVALVDDDDYDRVAQFKWHVSEAERTAYAVRTDASRTPHTTVRLHRFIVDAPDGVMIDHRDGNGLNCTRANLRAATLSQNQGNRKPWIKPKAAPPHIKGVHRAGNKWRAQISLNRRRIHIGCFSSVEEAARAYDKKAVEIFQQFARTNFVETA